jgi:uncharacterized RDD family membrane protein YckC
MMNSISTIQMASIGSRFIALVIDGVLLGAVTSALYPILGSFREVEGLLTFAFTIFYQWYFLTKYQGQTPGKMLLGIRVVKTDGRALSSIDAIARTLGYTLNWILLGLGWLLAFWDSNHQGLHDHIAGTHVVKVN